MAKTIKSKTAAASKPTAEEAKAVKKNNWLDAGTHRLPRFPVGGYAPGDYMNRCKTCEQTFYNMDKRAWQCFPCAVETLCQAANERHVEDSTFKAENRILKAAIMIINPDALATVAALPENPVLGR